MISQHTELLIVAFSVRVYQTLLVAYPTKFQQEYGAEMMQVFQDCCLRALRRGGTNGMVKLWTVTLFDLLQSVISEHMQKETDMNKADFIRLSGWLLMTSAVAFLPGAIGMILSETRYAIRSWDSFPFNVVAFAVFGAPLLLAVGILGLRARYGSAIGEAGRGVLLFGAIGGGLLVVVGTLVQFITPDYSVSETYYYVWLGGVCLLFTCLPIFWRCCRGEETATALEWVTADCRDMVHLGADFGNPGCQFTAERYRTGDQNFSVDHNDHSHVPPWIHPASGRITEHSVRLKTGLVK